MRKSGAAHHDGRHGCTRNGRTRVDRHDRFSGATALVALPGAEYEPRGAPLTQLILALILAPMGRTHRPQVALYLDPEHVELLDRLAKKSGRTKQDLLREAVHTLFVEHGMYKGAAARGARRPA